MAGYKFVVLSNPVAGHEEEYNDWYSNRHLADIVAIPGFSAAQRFVLRSTSLGEVEQKYLAIYEMDVDSLAAAQAALAVMAQTEMEVSPSLDGESIVTGLFEPCEELHSLEGTEPGPYKLLAVGDAVEKGADFNELMAAGGCSSVERYRLQGHLARSIDSRYIAVCNLSGKDWAAVEQALRKEAPVRLPIYEACSPRVLEQSSLP